MASNRYTRFIGALYVLNIAWQALFSLAAPIGVGFLISYLLVRYASAPGWIYAPLIVVGALSGLVSMIKFVLSAMAGLERLEKQQSSKEKHNEQK
ncbi:MAG: AtpZ/AtpI family protein [Clostridia bacterium]|nr:AtpZ/AtpI family protein [Clostridia bacterium]